MTGRPMLRDLARRIEDQGGDAVILDRIADGDTITKIARDWDVSRRMIYDWIHLDEEREQAWAKAKTMSADALVDQAADALESAPATPTNADVSLIDKRVNFKKWLAAKRDRDQYGEEEKRGVEVNVNLQELHLNALREAGGMNGHPKNQEIESVGNAAGVLTVQDADFEVVEEGVDEVLADLMEDDSV